MFKVSVIMPCLNVEKYISNCLDSVVNQTLKDIEIIVVDAGSTDNTLNIIKEFKSKDERIKLINSDKKSYGYQMNIAANIAQGEYIGIVETDDYIEKNAFDMLYREIVNTDADYIKGKAIAFFDQGNFKFQREYKTCLDWDIKNKVVVNPKRYPWLFISDNFIWNGLYRREYFQKFKFLESPGAAFQDIGVLFKLISNSEKAIYLNKIVYYYRQGDMLASSYNHKSLNFVKNEYSALENLLENLSEGWRYIFYRKMAHHLLNRFDYMSCEGVFWTEASESIIWLKKKLNYAIDNKILSKSNFSEYDWEGLKIFLNEGGYSLFQYYQNSLDYHTKITMNTIEQFKNREWIIFGCGAWGKAIGSIFRMFNIKVNAFCDNSSKKQGTKIYDLEILSPNEAVKTYKQTHFFISNKSHKYEIQQQLLKLGVNQERIFAKDISEEIYKNPTTLRSLYKESLKI